MLIIVKRNTNITSIPSSGDISRKLRLYVTKVDNFRRRSYQHMREFKRVYFKRELLDNEIHKGRDFFFFKVDQRKQQRDIE